MIVLFLREPVVLTRFYIMFYRPKENQKKTKNNFVEITLYLIAHDGSGFDSYVVLNILPQWRTNVKLIKNGAGNVSLKIFNGCR